MGYGYDPEETTGQEHMDGTAPESGGQEYTDSAQKTDASDMSAHYVKKFEELYEVFNNRVGGKRK